MVGAMQFFVSVTLLGMRTLAVEKLTFKEALQQPFEGYCAEAPDAQRSGFPEPPPVHLLRESNLQLRGVQLVFRHGARDLSSDKPCFKPLRRAFKNCSVQTLVSFTGLAPSDPEALVREVLDAFPLREADLPGSGYTSGLEGCGLGVLLDDAIPQTKALATELRRQYFHRFSEPPSMNATRLYSTGKLRTEATLFLMHRELFGDVPGARLFSRPVSSDPWDMNQHCPRAGHARHARHYKTSQALIEKRFPAFAKQWRLAAGTDFQAGFHDCLLVAKCSKQLELPEKLEPESSLFTEALRVSLLLFQEHYMHDPEALHLLAAPALVELEDFILRQAGNSMPLALWATHDTTILVLLAALGLWNGQWPPYTDTLLIEVYVKTGEIPMEPAAFFRFLHHGHPVTFPWCETYFPELPGLCDVKSFLPPWIAPFRDLRRLRDACYTRVERGTEASVELQELGGSAGNIAVKVLFGAFLLLLGYSWREISELTLRTRKLASARTVNLSECGLTAAVLPELCNALPKSLQEVQLSGNLLGPQALDTLVPWLGGLDLLHRLALGGCALGASASRLALFLQRSLPPLRVVNLRRNEIPSAACGLLTDAAVESATLQEFSLAANEATPEMLRRLEKALAKKMFIASVSSDGLLCDLRNRSFTTAGIQSITELREFSSLRSLDLRGNALTDEAAEVLLSGLGASIEEVLLSIDSPGARRLRGRAAWGALCGAWERCPATTAKAAGHRGLGDEGTMELASLMERKSRLMASPLQWSSLGLQHNAICSSGAVAFAGALPHCPQLRELLLYSNCIGPEGAAAICHALPASLTALDLGSNHLQNAGAKEAARGLAGHPQLRELHLDYNELDDDCGDALMSAVKEMPRLRSLWLQGNQLCTKKLLQVLEERPPLEAEEEPEAQTPIINAPLLPLESLKSENFAERCAHLAFERYFASCGAHALSARGQVVLAAILAYDLTNDANLWIVSLGVGTKFMPADAVRADVRHERVRDSHAEVLARRGLKRYLFKEVHSLLLGDASQAKLLKAVDTVGSAVPFKMREGVTLHLYVSTAPCGWASIRARAEAEDHGPRKVPFLVKGSGDAQAPAGCVGALTMGEAVSLSCSDKVARWQLQGIEGLLLSSLVRGPLRLSTITIGRKFDYTSCVLAFGWTPQPPTILQSSLSFEAALATARGSLATDFEKGDGDESYVWSVGDAQASMHDGRTGAALDCRGASRQAAPQVAGASLLALYKALPMPSREEKDMASPYKEVKNQVAQKLGTTLERRRLALLDAFQSRCAPETLFAPDPRVGSADKNQCTLAGCLCKVCGLLPCLFAWRQASVVGFRLCRFFMYHACANLCP
ncbi:unnamed protein product [Durusdinium trenchii]|uniref:A to I editase domain-containing protein n=1 Tax=Durusdinium trenchii TaxID=1381693 RepID=A0ABP0RE59_9DINO